jgi:hypothetical protein
MLNAKAQSGKEEKQETIQQKAVEKSLTQRRKEAKQKSKKRFNTKTQGRKETMQRGGSGKPNAYLAPLARVCREGGLKKQ